MNERLKEIRKAKDMNQLEFSKKLGISRSHLSGLENGAKKITDRIRIDICREFNVNEEWFRTGIGDNMFNDPLEDIVIKDLEIKDMVRMYLELDDNMKKVVKKFIESALTKDDE